MLAALAASIPAFASSKTIQSLGLTSNNLAAFKNTSGFGFPILTPLPSTIASNFSRRFTLSKIV